MANPIILGWRFWKKNPKILTLECNHPDIASCPDVLCSVYRKDSQFFLKYKNNQGQKTYPVKIKETLFRDLLRIVETETKGSCIERVIFCRQGIDFELSEHYDIAVRYKIMELIETSIQMAFKNLEIQFKPTEGTDLN